MVWIGVAVGAGLILLGGDPLIGTLRSRDGGDMMGMANLSLTPGIGAFVNLAAAAIAVAATLKGREEKLF